MKENALDKGTVLQGGKFTILKVLGSGGFGITYLAEQSLLQKKVAIKEFFLHDLCARDTTGVVTTLTQGDMVGRYRKKFVKEAQILARLNHPGIVRVTDVFEENGTVYYVMEYVEGESLSEMVKRRGSLPEPEALRYISKVASALAYIHQSKVNHLDLKPGNIMVRRSDDEPVLIDFGVSKQYDEQKNQTTTTPPGVSHGYSPIEQYKPGGVSTFSPQADIYSLGATLYKLLTGETPPNADDVLNKGLPPMPASISPLTRAAIVKAMRPRLVDRPGSVGEWIGMIDVGITPWRRVNEWMRKIGMPGFAKADDTLKIVNMVGQAGGEEIEVSSEETVPDINVSSGQGGSGVVPPVGTGGNPPRSPKLPRLAILLFMLLGVGLLVLFWEKPPHTIEPIEETADSASVEAVAEEEPGADEGKENIESFLACPDDHHPHLIDLGLPSGTKWACCNVGADKPEAYGGYYAWGETEEKSKYTLETYKHCDGTKETCHDLGSDIAGTQYDVAHVKWGGAWVIPSHTQQKELCENSFYEWTTMNGVKGGRFTSKKNGASIFFPVAGHRWDSNLYATGKWGSYWSSEPCSGSDPFARGMEIEFGNPNTTANSGRGRGESVRPVVRN